MNIDIRVPALPESVNDATVLTWHKKPGDPVRRDENLVDLETDKVVLEVPSPTDGVLRDIMSADGAVVEADDILGRIQPSEDIAEEPAITETDSEPVLTPSVRRLVKELNLDAASIQGSGKDGRILKSDVMRHLDQQTTQAPEAKVEAKEEPEPELAIAQVAEELEANQRHERRVPMSRLRARIAERLVQAQSTAAILTTFNEVNLQAIKNLRASHGDAFEKAHGVRLGFMSFFVKAVLNALRQFPVVNASIDGNDILYHDYYDIGIAVGSSRGLVVPVLRNADQLSFAGIEQAIRAFSKKAEAGTLSYEELSGGTFSISNGGVYGSMLSTPIINPPQSAILGMHNIIERPIAENGQVVIRPMMYLALSYDHRIIDGKDAVQFLLTIKQALEDPARMLLGV